MADLQGPKLRVGEIAGDAVELREGDVATLTAGIPFGRGKKTNMLEVHVMGEGEA